MLEKNFLFHVTSSFSPQDISSFQLFLKYLFKMHAENIARRIIPYLFFLKKLYMT